MTTEYDVRMSEQQYKDYLEYLTQAPNIQDVKKPNKKEFGDDNRHPTIKPVKLMEYLLTLLSTPDGGVILDPFAGSGTTLVAAQRLGRRCIGVELTGHNCEIARGRLHVR